MKVPEGFFLPRDRDRTGHMLEDRPVDTWRLPEALDHCIPLARCSSLLKVGQVEELEASVAFDSTVDEDHVVDSRD